MLNLEHIEELPEHIGTAGRVDGFYHIAWLGTRHPRERFDMRLQADNIRHAITAVEVSRMLECEFFVGAGSQAEYGAVSGVLRPDTPAAPLSGYGMAKLCAGQMTRALCSEYGIRHVWSRILSVYGVYDSPQRLIHWMIRQLLEGGKPALTAGEQMWDYLYADDAAEALFSMGEMGRDGAIYVLGSGEVHPLRHYLEIIRDAVNPRLTLGFGERPYIRDQVMHLEADITALVKDMGWHPHTSFSEGIRKILHFEYDM
jgi:hypothetical protein